MIRLLVNAGGRTVGSEVSIGELGEEFAQQLLDAGQAVAVTPIDPTEPVLEQVGELALQVEAAELRISTIVVQAEGLDSDGRRRVANAILEVLRTRARNGSAGLNDLLDFSDLEPVLSDERGESDERGLDIARRLNENLSGQLDQAKADLIEEQQRSAALSDELDAARAAAAATHTPLTPAGPSGDAAGAEAPAVEPAAPEAAPAAPPGGVAKPRKPRA